MLTGSTIQYPLTLKELQTSKVKGTYPVYLKLNVLFHLLLVPNYHYFTDGKAEVLRVQIIFPTTHA